MKLWQHSLDELCPNKSWEVRPEITERQPFDVNSIDDIAGHPEYGLATLPDDPDRAHQVLVHWESGEPIAVGYYVDDFIYVEKGHRNNGVPEELFLACLAHRAGPKVSDNFTAKGYRLLQKAHKLAVERALAASEEVRDEVRNQVYPDL